LATKVDPSVTSSIEFEDRHIDFAMTQVSSDGTWPPPTKSWQKSPLQFGDIDRSSGVVVTEPETNIAIDIATMPQRTMDSSRHFVRSRSLRSRP